MSIPPDGIPPTFDTEDNLGISVPVCTIPMAASCRENIGQSGYLNKNKLFHHNSKNNPPMCYAIESTRSVTARPSLQTLASLRADVVFGSPRRQCAGSGICRIVAWSDLAMRSVDCPQYSVHLYKTGPTELLLELPLNALSTDQFDRLFSGPHFVVEATYRLPLSITRKFFGFRMEITAGEYPFTIRQGQLSIRLPLQPSRGAATRQYGLS